MQLSGAYLAFLFMLRAMSLLAGGVAIFDQLASVARFEATAILSASGTLVRRAHGNI